MCVCIREGVGVRHMEHKLAYFLKSTIERRIPISVFSLYRTIFIYIVALRFQTAASLLRNSLI